MAQTRTENLALHFQEVLTAIVRLRANRQAVSDAESFRHHIREWGRVILGSTFPRTTNN